MSLMLRSLLQVSLQALVPAPTPPVVWVRVDRPSFDLWGVIVTSAEFVGLSIAVAFLLGSALGWLLIRRGQPAAEPAAAGLGLRPAHLPGVDGRLPSRSS